MIRVSSKYDIKSLTALNRNAYKNVFKMFLFIVPLFIIVGLLLYLPDENWAFCIGFIIGSNGFLFILIGLIYLMIPLTVKRHPQLKQHITADMKFDDKIHIYELSEYSKVDSEHDWRIVIKAVEVKDYIFLYIHKMAAYIIDKSQIEEGTLFDLHNLLIEKLNKKYKINKKYH